jgi:hypothetical protein
LKGILWDSATMNSRGSEVPTVWGNKMSNWSQCESKARWKAPVKKRRREKIWSKNRKG